MDAGLDLEWAKMVEDMVGISLLTRIKALELRMRAIGCPHKNTKAIELTKYGSWRECLDCKIKFGER